eukprot:10086549-Prorocentrum_lima.AAC.1
MQPSQPLPTAGVREWGTATVHTSKETLSRLLGVDTDRVEPLFSQLACSLFELDGAAIISLGE